MTIFIILAIIGWVISFLMAIYGMIVSWRNKTKDEFYEAMRLFLLSILLGMVVGWAAVVAFIKYNVLDKHFDDEPGRTKG